MARGEEAPERKTGVAGWRESQGSGSQRPGAGTRHNKANADRNRRKVMLVLLGVLCVASLVCSWPITERITRGLWLKGGTQTTLEATKADGTQPTSDELVSSARILNKRIVAMGVSEVETRVEGTEAILVDLPWYVDNTAITDSVCGSGVLEFVRVDEIGDADALAKINAGTSNVQLADGTYTPFMDGSVVKSASVTEVSSGIYAVTIEFNDEGKTTFADVTRELAESGGSIAICIDGRVVTAPSVSEEINGGQVSISGGFSAHEARALKAVIDTGSVPVRLANVDVHDIGPLLGGEVILGILIALVAAFVVVTILALRRFGKLGLIVTGSMAVFAVVLLGIMALFSRLRMFGLTLPGLTGGMLASLSVTTFAWLLVDAFHSKIMGGGSVKSAATTAVGDALGPLFMPIAIGVVAAVVFLFLPIATLRHFGRIIMFAVASGVVALFWFAVTTLRLLAMGSIQSDPAAWGFPAKGGSAVKGSTAAVESNKES